MMTNPNCGQIAETESWKALRDLTTYKASLGELDRYWITTLRPETEHWKVCRPMIHGGAGQPEIYVGWATFMFFDGLVVTRLIYIGKPEEILEDVVREVTRRIRHLPPPPRKNVDEIP